MDEPILKTPGELLAEAREATGLTLAQLAETTKIPVRQLESIERDEYHKLSGPLYVKSFLRAYAEAVGLDAGTLLELYARSTGERPRTGGGDGADVWAEDKVTITRVGLPWARIAALAAAVVLVVVIVWLIANRFVGGSDGTLQRTAAVAEPTAGRATQTPAPTSDRIPPDSAAAPMSPAPGPAAAADTSSPVTPAGQPAELPPTVAADSLARSFGQLSAEAVRRAEARAGRGRPASAAQDRRRDAADGAAADLVIAGRTWPMRLRLLARVPLRIKVKREGQGEFQVTDVPSEGADAPALPAGGVEPGRVYAAREGLVAYWGADEYFEFSLDRTDGVELTINGEACDIGGVGPEQTKMLFRETLQSGSLR